MITPFLSGLLAAWAAAQVALGAFFCLAFAFGRREGEYLLFGLTTLSLAVATAGTSWEYASLDVFEYRAAAVLTAVGLMAAVPTHLHFLLFYSRRRRTHRIAVGAYLVAAVFLVLRLGGYWFRPGTEKAVVARLFDYEVVYFNIGLQPQAFAFFVMTAATLVVGSVLLFRVYRLGRREALFAFLGSVVLLLATVNDVALVAGATHDSIYLWPHAFLVYAAALASTLLYRYRSAAGQLEETALSLRERIAELQHSYHELSVMEAELTKQQRLAAVGELAASIAHEVRNPLAVIVNATAGLRRRGLPARDESTLLEMVDEEVARLNRLVSNLLRFARPVSVTSSPVDLRELAEHAGANVGSQHQVVVDIADDREVSTAWVDPAQLRLAVENLIENACQAMPDGGRIDIIARQTELDDVPAVELVVRDHGSGMKADVRERAMHPFFTTRSSGTGLGLPIVRRILQAHEGDIRIESTPGRGTSVSLIIPRVEPEADVMDRPSRRLRRRLATS